MSKPSLGRKIRACLDAIHSQDESNILTNKTIVLCQNTVSRPGLTVYQKWNYLPAAVWSEHQQVENDPDLLNYM